MTTALTQSHWESWIKEHLPSARDERWKYADLTFLKQNNWVVAEEPVETLSKEALIPYRLSEASALLLVLVNGRFNPTLSDLNQLPEGVTAGFPTPVPLSFNEAMMPSPFAMLNQSIAHQGLFLSVPDGLVLESPIHVLHLVAGEASYVMHPRIQILLGEGSQCTVFEEYASLSQSAYLVNALTEAHVKRHALLQYTKLQRESHTATHLAQINIYPAEASHVRLAQFAVGARFSRDEVSVHLDEPYAICQTSGFYYLKRTDQYVDHHIDIVHRAKSCRSEMRYKGIVGARAKAIFNGKLKVEESASQTEAYQANHHLLMAADGEAYSKPELEIDAESVACKHGATTGYLNEAALFYLQSRGVPVEEAKSMLLSAFAEEIFQGVMHAGIRERVRSI